MMAILPFALDRIDHRQASQFAARIVVGSDMRDHFGGFVQAGDIGGKDRNARFVGLLNGRADGARVARAENDSVHFFDNEIVDLIFLPRRIEFARRDDDFDTLASCLPPASRPP